MVCDWEGTLYIELQGDYIKILKEKKANVLLKNVEVVQANFKAQKHVTELKKQFDTADDATAIGIGVEHVLQPDGLSRQSFQAQYVGLPELLLGAMSWKPQVQTFGMDIGNAALSGQLDSIPRNGCLTQFRQQP